MDKISESKRWIEFAEKDYEAAILLESNPKPLLEIVCFHCQQSAEKYLKAFIIKNEGEIKRTHNLEEILRTCERIDIEFKEIRDNCIDLTDYAVETRYPYPFEINETDMKKAVYDMKVIRKFIENRMK